MTTLPPDQTPIVALASGRDAAAISILRVSGVGCHEIVKAHLRTRMDPAWPARALQLCEFVDETGRVLDAPMAVFFYGSHSYTGQDSAEIYLHGSPYVIRTCLDVLFRAGCRQAEGGEFTRRAFLNGKIDLATAEGIDALIHSVSEQQWMAAQQLTTGALQATVGELRKTLLQTSSLLNAMIDFPEEEETSRLQLEQILPSVLEVKARMDTLVDSYQSGAITRNGLQVAIVGPPNAGKSTLLNTLLQYERAIISPEPGTTRDFLEESLLLNGRVVRLIDTAGIRATPESVESMGIERSVAQAEQADVVLFLFPADTVDVDQLLAQWVDKLQPKQHIALLTQIDARKPSSETDSWLALSCHTGVGVDLLKAKLIALVDFHVTQSRSQDCFISNRRHLHAMSQARDNLDTYLQSWQQEGEDCLAFEIQQAVSHLEAIIGKITPDEILDSIFTQFCIGK